MVLFFVVVGSRLGGSSDVVVMAAPLVICAGGQIALLVGVFVITGPRRRARPHGLGAVALRTAWCASVPSSVALRKE